MRDAETTKGSNTARGDHSLAEKGAAMTERNTARDAAMYQMMLRTGMIWEMEDDQEVRVQIHQNAGASCGSLKRSIPADDTIPRATVAAALAELRAQAEAGAEKWFGHHNEANIYQDFIESISATIAKLGSEEAK